MAARYDTTKTRHMLLVADRASIPLLGFPARNNRKLIVGRLGGTVDNGGVG
jgi:hypothetical protein